MTGNPGWRLSSVANAARLLKEFSRDDRELGVSELSRRLGLATSTVHRLLATLTDERLLERGSAPGGYRLGLAIFDLGASVAAGGDLHEAALPVMATLRASTGETVQLAVLDGLESVYVDRLESPHTVRIFSRVGTRLPATTTSTGKVLLAGLAPEELAARLAQWEPRRITPHTIVDLPTLRSRLDEVAERGWAENLRGVPDRGRVGRRPGASTRAGPSSPRSPWRRPTDRAGAGHLAPHPRQRHRVGRSGVAAHGMLRLRSGRPRRARSRAERSHRRRRRSSVVR